MIRRNKSKKGSIGKKRPELDYKAIAKGQSKPKNKAAVSLKRRVGLGSQTTKKKTNRPSASSAAQKNRIFNKRKQRSANDQNPFTSSANPSDIPRKVRKKSIVDKSKRGASTKAIKTLKDGFAIGDQYGKAFGLKKGGKAKMMAGGKASKYRAAGGGKMPMVMKDGKKIPAFAADGKGKMKAGGKTTKYMKKGGKAKMMKGGKTTKYMAKGGKTTKYMAKGGKTSKYMARGGRAK